MLFSSIFFLFAFLPVVLGVYFLLPARGRNLALLLASLLFYSWGEQELVLIMLCSVFADYFAGIWIEKGYRKQGLAVSLIVNLGLLGFFKYANFTFENYHTLLELLGVGTHGMYKLPEIALPLGISFYTFQTLSYTIDVYKGRVKATRNFINFATYVTLFPQLLAGPIVRYRDIEKQLKERNENRSQFATGVERFIIGLAKKVILANSFAVIADAAFALPTSELSVGFAWLGVTAFFLQLYFDFAGYSDMAIGMGKMFGFDFPENFIYPITARSITVFWQKWHITLSTWFRDYVFFPLVRRKGKRRTSLFRVYFSIIIVFTAIGFWHGANWNMIVFGFVQSVFIILERIKKQQNWFQAPRWLEHIYAIWAFLMSAVLFRAVSLSQAWEIYQVMYGAGEWGWGLGATFLNMETAILMLAAVTLCLPTYMWAKSFFQKLILDRPAAGMPLIWLYVLFLMSLFILCASYIASANFEPFIYFRF